METCREEAESETCWVLNAANCCCLFVEKEKKGGKTQVLLKEDASLETKSAMVWRTYSTCDDVNRQRVEETEVLRPLMQDWMITDKVWNRAVPLNEGKTTR